MKKVYTVLFTGMIVCCLFFIGCSVNPSKVDPEYAKKFVNNVTYAKDTRTGLCYAVVASRKTGDTDQNGLGLSCVSCEAVKHLLVN